MKPDANFAVVSIDALRLVLPQTDVQSIESAAQVEREGALAPAIGTLELASGRWPVYCCDASLQPIAHVPAQRKVCLVLQGAEGPVALLCDELRALPAASVSVHRLPAPMQSAGSPLRGLLLLEEEAAFPLASGPGLLAALGPRPARIAAEEAGA